MATITQFPAGKQQGQGTGDTSAARAFWDKTMEAHPRFAGVLAIIGAVLEFFIGGHFIVAIAHKIIIVSGRVAESVLLGAALWITAINIANSYITQLVGGGNVSTWNAWALLAFSLLPEVIVFAAIVTTFEHWLRFARDRRWANPAWVWGLLYLIPTATFIGMTLYTIGSFVSRSGVADQITGGAIVVRCFAGWFYCLVEIVYLSLGRKGIGGALATPEQQEDMLTQAIEKVTLMYQGSLRNAFEEMQRVSDQKLTRALEQFTGVSDQKLTRALASFAESQRDEIAGVIAQYRADVDEQIARVPEVVAQRFDVIIEQVQEQTIAPIETMRATIARFEQSARLLTTRSTSSGSNTPANRGQHNETSRGQTVDAAPNHDLDTKVAPEGQSSRSGSTNDPAPGVISEGQTEKPVGVRVQRFIATYRVSKGSWPGVSLVMSKTGCGSKNTVRRYLRAAQAEAGEVEQGGDINEESEEE